MGDEKEKAFVTVASVTSAGGVAGAAVAAAGVAFAIPVAIGAGLAAIEFAVAKGVTNSKSK